MSCACSVCTGRCRLAFSVEFVRQPVQNNNKGAVGVAREPCPVVAVAECRQSVYRLRFRARLGVARDRVMSGWDAVEAGVTVTEARHTSAEGCVVFTGVARLLSCMTWRGTCASRHGMHGMCRSARQMGVLIECKCCIPSNLFMYNEADNRAWR